MLKQLRYFQAVVENKSFSKAAEECFISQSAISQQVQALERDIGVRLLERKGRSFSVTPAGEHLYRKSRPLLREWERLVRETQDIERGSREAIRLGCLRSYSGPEFQRAVLVFSERHPEIELHIRAGSHEELYELLVSGQIDLLLSDQRRAFSQGYFNEILAARPYQAELVARHPIAQREAVAVEDLKALPCILVSSAEQRDNERDYYRDIVGLQGDFLYAGSLEEGRLLAAGGKGFLLLEGADAGQDGSLLRRVPLTRSGRPLLHNYCAFWSRENTGRSVHAFADVLKAQFEELNG